jgi:hypothetical protein
MIHVVLDTNIFSADRKREKTAFRALERLGSKGKLQLHVPYFVREEFLSQQRESLKSAFSKIDDSLKTLTDVAGDKRVLQFVEETKKRLTIIRDEAKAYVGKEFNSWVRGILAKEYGIAHDHGARVAVDYFNGTPPFKTPKNRNDLPDNFIWQTILDVKKQVNRLHIVVNDGQLRETAKADKGLIVYKDLTDFMNTDVCQEALKEITDEPLLINNMERILEILSDNEREIQNMIETDIIEAIIGQRFTDELLPDEETKAEVVEARPPSLVMMHLASADYYGENEIGIEFEAHMDCIVEYALYKGHLERAKRRIAVEDRNEYYFGIKEPFELESHGVLQLKPDAKRLRVSKLDDKTLKEEIEGADHKVEITKVNILPLGKNGPCFK